MKKVLVLGAGRVSRPCVDYLGRLGDTVVHVADVSEDNLRQTVAGIPGAKTHVCDAGGQGDLLLEAIKTRYSRQSPSACLYGPHSQRVSKAQNPPGPSGVPR